jgi:predicted  nucleic acid-binding Zn-ribbon protein
MLFEKKKEEYKKLLIEEKENFENQIAKIKNELEDFRIRRESINEAILREKQIQEQEAFYKIDIPKSVQEDI